MNAGVSIDRARIRLPGLWVYLELAVAPPGLLPTGVVPRPHGVAPSAMSQAGEVVAAVGATEVVWLGFQALERSRPRQVRVRVDGAEPVDALTGEPWAATPDPAGVNHLLVPPESRLVGLPTDDGVAPLRAGTHLTVFVADPPGRVAIKLMSPTDFERSCGWEPPSMEPGSAYTGWRAP